MFCLGHLMGWLWNFSAFQWCAWVSRNCNHAMTAFIACWHILCASIMANFTNKIGVERVVDVSRPYAFLPCSIVSVPIGCGGCWPLPRAGLMSWVLGCLFWETRLLVGLFIGHPLVGMADVASELHRPLVKFSTFTKINRKFLQLFLL